MEKAYSVVFMPVDRRELIVPCDTLLLACQIVAWGYNRARVYEYETEVDLEPYIEAMESIERDT